MALAIWPLTALAFDGRSHNNFTGQEAFFSTPHTFMYAGMTVAALWISWLVVRHQLEAGADPGRGRVDLRAIPAGYGIAIVGLAMLAVGGPADFLWHSAYGFEVGVDAVYSPPHLLLFTGGALAASTGIRSMWAKAGSAPDLVRFLPVVVSSALTLFMLGFMSMYLSAYMTNVSPTGAFNDDIERLNDVRFDQSVGLAPGLTGYGDDAWPYHYYSAGHGMAAMIITTAILLGPVLILLRRWRPPFGAVTLSYLGFGLLFSVLTEYRDAVLIASLVVAGATVDLLARRLRPAEGVSAGALRIIGTSTAATLWSSYYAVLALAEGIGWEAPMIAGALVIGVLTGLGVSILVAPPAVGQAPEKDAAAP